MISSPPSLLKDRGIVSASISSPMISDDTDRIFCSADNATPQDFIHLVVLMQPYFNGSCRSLLRARDSAGGTSMTNFPGCLNNLSRRVFRSCDEHETSRPSMSCCTRLFTLRMSSGSEIFR